MESEKYAQMPLEKQIQTLYVDGEFVMDIRYYEFKVGLYLLKDFYVEVFYHHKEDKIKRIKILDRASSRMKFYTDQVKLKVA